MRVVFNQKWKILMIACCITYAVFIYLPSFPADETERAERSKFQNKKLRLDDDMRLKQEIGNNAIINEDNLHDETRKNIEKPYFHFQPSVGESFYVEEVMTNSGISLAEKMSCKADKNAAPKIILSINAGHDQSNLGGCPEWNCLLTKDKSKVDSADALMFTTSDKSMKRRNDQYYIYFSQESPKNSGYQGDAGDFFNMTLGFRHDSPAASPYGYTVKLAPASRKTGQLIDPKRVNGKTKGGAWFVSHCSTNSRREQIVATLQKSFPVDIYGSCGTLRCPRGAACENALDDDYHFYIAFENSICKDYLTEKLWNQGYGRDVVPVVLERKIVEEFVPPNSFIALDDFKSTQDLAKHLSYLMENKTAYMEYFNWRRDYKVIFLNGNNHDILEKPWGFCQICRILWEAPRKHYSIPNFKNHWTDSCEMDGALAGNILRESHMNAIS